MHIYSIILYFVVYIYIFFPDWSDIYYPNVLHNGGDTI